MTTTPSVSHPVRDAVLVGLVLTLVVASGWVYLVRYSLASSNMPSMNMGNASTMMMQPAWSLSEFGQVLLMWMIMMTAMMLPSAASPIYFVASRPASLPRKMGALSSATLFGAGYLLIWSVCGALATILHWQLDSNGLLSSDTSIRSLLIAGLLLFAIGLYQFTPWKKELLRRCRNSFHSRSIQPSNGGGAIFRLGIQHGLSCLGCCWNLMLVLFVTGPMNLVWIGVITVWVLAERTLPRGERIAQVGGAALIAWGVYTIALLYISGR